jgi:hypothetical protein
MKSELQFVSPFGSDSELLHASTDYLSWHGWLTPEKQHCPPGLNDLESEAGAIVGNAELHKWRI